MTTTIVPSAGAGALFTQQGTGTTPGYSALDIRRSDSGALQEGVYGTSTLVTAGGVGSVGAADFMVTQRAAGANMSVDVNMPAGGFAWVQGDTINGQGLYAVPVHSANINETIAAADATNPRVDQVILEVQDNVLDASGGNIARTRVLTGSPQVGATLNNRLGAVALPGNALLLADVLVGALVSSVANAVMRDRRKWARGAHLSIQGNAAADLSTTSTTFVDPTTTLDSRLELSNCPFTASFNGHVQHSVAGAAVLIGLLIDGSEIARDNVTCTNAGVVYPFYWQHTFFPGAGSRVMTVGLATSVAGTATLKNVVTLTPRIELVERVTQLTGNNTVTSG